jgi:hypothetical protein
VINGIALRIALIRSALNNIVVPSAMRSERVDVIRDRNLTQQHLADHVKIAAFSKTLAAQPLFQTPLLEGLVDFPVNLAADPLDIETRRPPA